MTPFQNLYCIIIRHVESVSLLDYEGYEYWEHAALISLSPLPGMWGAYMFAGELAGWLNA